MTMNDTGKTPLPSDEACEKPRPLSDMISSASASCEMIELMQRSVISAQQEIEMCCDPTFQDEWWALVEERYSTVYVIFTPGGAFGAPVAGTDLVLQLSTADTAGQKLRFFSHGMHSIGGFSSVGTGPSGTSSNPLAGDNLPFQLTFAQTNAHANSSVGGTVDLDSAVLVAQQYQDYFAIGASLEVGTPFTMVADTVIPLFGNGIFEGDASYEERIKKSLYEMASFDIDVQIGSGSTDGWRMGPISDWTSPYGQMGHKAYTRGQPMPGSYRKFTSWLQTNSRPRVTALQDAMSFSLALPPALTIPNKTTNPTLAQNYFVPVILHLFGLNVCLSEIALNKVIENINGRASSGRARGRKGSGNARRR